VTEVDLGDGAALLFAGAVMALEYFVLPAFLALVLASLGFRAAKGRWVHWGWPVGALTLVTVASVVGCSLWLRHSLFG
jgi:uncharacterized membrane protein (DUF485 family)